MTTRRNPLHVHVDQLVQEGFGHEGDRIRDAVAHKLAPLSIPDTRHSQNEAISTIDGGTFGAREGADASGKQVARAIHGTGGR